MYEIDVIIPAHEKDLDTLDLCISNVKKYVQYVRNVYVISKNKLTEKAEWYPEGNLPFTIQDVGNVIGFHKRTAWYYADLLEMHAATLIDGLSEHVLILDSDTIFTRHVTLIDLDGKCLLNTSPTDGLGSYYEWVERFMGLKKSNRESGITHFILQRKSIVEEFVRKAESLYNAPFWKAALEITNQEYIDINDNNHATGQGKMAGFELYFMYALHHHPDKVKIKKLRSILSYKEHIGVEGYLEGEPSRSNCFGNVWSFTPEERETMKFSNVKEALENISERLGEKGWDVVTFQNHTRIGSKNHYKDSQKYIEELK